VDAEHESSQQQGGAAGASPHRSAGSLGATAQQDSMLEHCGVQSGQGFADQGVETRFSEEAILKQQAGPSECGQQGQRLSMLGSEGSSPHAADEQHQMCSIEQGM
jgi:hypothetical protein